MPYSKTNLYPTHCTSTSGNNLTQNSNFDHERSPPVWIPTLDLQGLNCDDDKDQVESFGVAKDKRRSVKEGENVLFVRKLKPSFVFPTENLLMNLEMMKNNSAQLKYEEDTNITSVDSYTNCKTTDESLPANRSLPYSYNQNHIDENTISFSLSEPNIERYLRFEHGNLETHGYVNGVESTDMNLNSQGQKCDDESERVSRFREKTKCSNSDKDDSTDTSQDIIDVIIVNGHSKSDVESDHHGDQDDDSHVHAQFVENNSESEKSKDKSKLRVTFSFEENLTPHGSIKRYTPIKGDANFKPQGVLKKRPPASHVSNHSSSDDRCKRDRYVDTRLYKDGATFSSSSYHLQNNQLGLEHGIPVKHIHTTNADLEKKQSKMYATNVVHKPPVPSSSSTRITLSMAAEKAAVGGSSRRILSRSHNYSSAHTRGRMAYFRPADGSRQPVSPSIRSKSAEDLNYSESKSRLHSDSHSKSSKSRANLPFTLRRCASSDHELLMGSKQKPGKPKVAFGTFILPKEPVCTVRNTQIQFQDVDSKSSSQGGYVHTYTRRSPYAAPTQIYIKENQKPDMSRRPVTAQARHTMSQQASSAKDLTQRHSAPSSYAPTRDKTFQNSQGVRLSINTSPNRSQSMKTHVSVPMKSTHTLTPNVSRESLLMRTAIHSGAQLSRVRKNADFDQQSRPNIAAMNMISKRDKGASHNRFVTKLRDFGKEVS